MVVPIVEYGGEHAPSLSRQDTMAVSPRASVPDLPFAGVLVSSAEEH
jgi:hypothetical protein